MALPARTSALGSPLAKPPPPATAQPATRPSPQHATSSTHCRLWQAPAHSAAAADARSVQKRSSDVSCAICARLGASDAAPASPMALPAHIADPRLAPRKSPPPAPALRPTAPAHNTQHHPRTAGGRRHPLTAQAAADARSIPPRSSDVSCVIPPRLGVSDAAPAALIRLPARTAAPRLAPSKPRHPLQPATRNHCPCTAAVSKHSPAA
jgi:hypothetical protein